MTEETKLSPAHCARKEAVVDGAATPLLFKMLSKDNFPVATCHSDKVRAGFSGLSIYHM